MHRKLLLVALTSAVLAAPVSAQVAPFGTFGSLPPNSFGGTGIPTNAVMLGAGVGGVTMGLSATPRYFSPALTNDGAGTFFANTGISVGGPTNAGFAAWNFDYFVGNNPGYFFYLYVDTDPAVGNALTNAPIVFGGNFAGSSNLGYVPGFDPMVPGEYTFELVQIGAFGAVDHVAMNVEVGTTTTPEPASAVLFGTGLIGLLALGATRRAHRNPS